jgi:hypothetical protein
MLTGRAISYTARLRIPACGILTKGKESEHNAAKGYMLHVVPALSSRFACRNLPRAIMGK